MFVLCVVKSTPPQCVAVCGECGEHFGDRTPCAHCAQRFRRLGRHGALLIASAADIARELNPAGQGPGSDSAEGEGYKHKPDSFLGQRKWCYCLMGVNLHFC